MAFAAAVLLGEYAFDGLAVVGAGVILGLFVSEATVSVARRGSVLLAGAGAVFTAAGLLGAAWIATDRRLSNIDLEGWLAVALGAAAAAIRARPPRERPPREQPDSPPPEPEPAG